ncbi:MAG: hypothetical protein JJU46_06035 [Balneolaceae bacterium]|nr:hypothetical protein [Balneolaceae bacterium]MCH8547349.1 hypothetical protein [Balneolaceae bacterium]
MISKPAEDSILTDFILDYCDSNLSNGEVRSLQDLMSQSDDLRISCEGGRSVKKIFNQLPERKARPGFSQRMVAAFAMELERESVHANINRMILSGKIKD